MVHKAKNICSQSSVSVGSTSVDSSNHGSKIFGEKVPESSKKQNLNLFALVTTPIAFILYLQLLTLY